MELSDRLAFYRDYPYRQISVAGTAWRYRTGGAADGPCSPTPPPTSATSRRSWPPSQRPAVSGMRRS